MYPYKQIGERGRIEYLRGSKDYPLNEAALRNLFGMPNTSENRNIRRKRILMTPLNFNQIEDIANFVELKRYFEEYYYYNHCQFPNSLDEPINIPIPRWFGEPLIDTLYNKDRYGFIYYYKNLGAFVVLGTSGRNTKWDFNSAIIDSIDNDMGEHIFVNDDDILVKFMPIE